MVVHRKKTDDLYKDTDDIRENIINYEDEGGGEGDMTGYDLNVLRLMYDDPHNEKQLPNNTHLIQRGGWCPLLFIDLSLSSVTSQQQEPFESQPVSPNKRCSRTICCYVDREATFTESFLHFLLPIDCAFPYVFWCKFLFSS